MRKRFLGSVAALAAGAGAAWGQPPVEPIGPSGPPPGLPGSVSGLVAPAPPIGGPSAFGGTPANAIPGNAGYAPPGIIMPPGNYGPPHDPLGLGPVGGFGPPPGPMYPMPGQPGAQSFQPAPPMPGERRFGQGGKRDLNYSGAPTIWFGGEYLLWFTEAQPMRFPLLTTSAPADGGVLGASSTNVLVGMRNLDYNGIDGFRLYSGFYGDADRRFGFELNAMVLERVVNRQVFGNLDLVSGIPTLARPFIDVAGVQSTIVLSGPDFGPARVEVSTSNQTWGIEPAGLWNIYRSQPDSRMACSIDFLAGYKFLQVREELRITSTTNMDDETALPVFVTGPFGIITQLPPIIGPAITSLGGVDVGGPAVITINDQFRSTNRFNGIVLGLKTEARYGMMTASAFGKVGIGNMHQRVEVFGGSSFADPTGASGTTTGIRDGFDLGVGGGQGAALGGVLANASNIGTYNRDRFSYIPEFGVNFGVALTRGLTGYIGVSAIYIPEVSRPGMVVNPVASSGAIPFSSNYGAFAAPRGPGFAFRETDLWMGGVSFGMRYRY